MQFGLKVLIKIYDYQVTGQEKKPHGSATLSKQAVPFLLTLVSANPIEAMPCLHHSSLALPLTPLPSVMFQEIKHYVDKVLLQFKSRVGEEALKIRTVFLQCHVQNQGQEVF